jgi:hypothetical protein
MQLHPQDVFMDSILFIKLSEIIFVDITEPVKVVKIRFMRFQILTVTSMKMTAFWDIAPCSLTEMDRRFRDVYCPIVITLIMESVRTSETSVYF